MNAPDAVRAEEAGLRTDGRGSLLVISGLRVEYGQQRRAGIRRREQAARVAVDDVAFDIRQGEALGLVGESGCGKSTIARAVMRLVQPTAGRLVFDGIDLLSVRGAELRNLRRRLQMVFQDPYSSLDPRMTARTSVEEPLLIHGIESREQRRKRALDALRLVGLGEAQAGRRPHALSGGQRQRVAIARALVLSPDMLVLDEPVSALDVSVQAQVLNLLADLQRRLRLTYLFITHDLAVAEHVCDRVAVVYLGRIMEIADRKSLFEHPLHPYTVGLLAAAPTIDEGNSRPSLHVAVRGEPAEESPDVKGCVFRARCAVGRGRRICREERPPLVCQSGDHWVACHFPGEADQGSSESAARPSRSLADESTA